MFARLVVAVVLSMLGIGAVALKVKVDQIKPLRSVLASLLYEPPTPQELYAQKQVALAAHNLLKCRVTVEERTFFPKFIRMGDAGTELEMWDGRSMFVVGATFENCRIEFALE